VAWDLVQTFLAAEFSQAERHLRRPWQSCFIGISNDSVNTDKYDKEMSMSSAVSPLTDSKLDQLCINTIRTLSIDAVQQPSPGTLAPRWRLRRWCTPFGIE
jgi:hypothetical protein